MFQALANKLFGSKHDRAVKKMRPMVDRIGEIEAQLEPLDDDQLSAKTADFRQRIENGEPLDDLLPEAFATVRVAAQRVLGMRHYDVQVIGGIVLHEGKIAEMKTGEGKTLTATLPMYLNALSGKGAHLITVNDYLASRDAEWMGQVYRFLGLEVGTIVADISDTQRRDAYRADITYGTNNEFGFDYLRDNMKYSLDRMVQRDLNYAIVDEVDSILIDEARTPLIISGQAEQATELYYSVNEIVVKLKRDEHYIVDEEHRSVTLTDEGVEEVERMLGIENLFEPTNIEYLHHVSKALEAHTLYKRDEKYLVRDGKVIIVDDFTGRAMPGRRWSDGLHQAIEAKEGVPIQNESITMATITYQNYFRMYDKLAGMTGTAETEEEEFQKIYELDVVVIPTNEPVIRLDQPDVVFRTEREKFAAIVDQILDCHDKGQPVLVGTVSVDKSEVISRVLKKKRIKHEVLNAKYHGREAEIVAQAGRKGAVTIATNMAGRGTDILLGGNPEGLAKKVNPDEDSKEFNKAFEHFKELCVREKQEVLDAGGLFILGTERHESRRIDNQLRGRSGRQGDPGESRFFLSLEDDLMRRFGADKIQGLMQRLGMEDGVPIEHNMVTKSIENAQRKVEGRNFDIRKNLLEYDDVMNLQRQAIYDLRRQILDGEDIEELILDVLDESLQNIVNTYTNLEQRPDEWDMEGLARELKEYFNLEVPAEELPRDREQLEAMLWGQVERQLEAKVEELEYIAERYNERFADDADFEPKTANDVFHDFARETYLKQLDKLYRDHLQAMRALREQVGLHGYAQRDPKQIYKKEGYDLFQAMRADVNANVSRYIMRLEVRREESVKAAQLGGSTAKPPSGAAAAVISMRARAPQAASNAQAAQQVAGNLTKDAAGTVKREVPKVGRNDPCPCGSGKKYKKCHMRKDRDAARAARAKAKAKAADAADDGKGDDEKDEGSEGIRIM